MQLAPAGSPCFCAGALQSPQLLMLSGIGPAAPAEMGIEVKVDLPGGRLICGTMRFPMSLAHEGRNAGLNRSLRGRRGLALRSFDYLLTRQREPWPCRLRSCRLVPQ